jgi:hypothetical protein
MKVYLVWYWYYDQDAEEGYHLNSIWSSEEKAEFFLKHQGFIPRELKRMCKYREGPNNTLEEYDECTRMVWDKDGDSSYIEEYEVRD